MSLQLTPFNRASDAETLAVCGAFQNGILFKRNLTVRYFALIFSRCCKQKYINWPVVRAEYSVPKGTPQNQQEIEDHILSLDMAKHIAMIQQEYFDIIEQCGKIWARVIDMKCSKCGNEFEGKFCPNCGTPVNGQPTQTGQQAQPTYSYGQFVPMRKKKNPMAVVGIIIGSIVALFILIVAFTPSNESGSNKQVSPAAVQASSKSLTDGAIEVDYKTLYKEYTDNPINADSKYKGKKLILSGTIDTIDREIDQSPYITFKIDYLQDIRIDFSKDEESKIAKLKKGQKIKIVGTCGGTLLSTTIVINDSSIVQ